MNVITSRPIIDGDTTMIDNFSNAGGKADKKKRRKEVGKKIKEGGNKAYVRLKEAGAIPVIENLLGLQPSNPPTTEPTDGNILPPTEPTPMSTTKKVLIGVGIAGAIGLIWYFGFRKDAPKK